jgi:hypothetical protein
MTVQNLATARFVLQCLLDELEEYDRCIPVARNVQVGDVTDALLTILSNRELQRLAMPKKARTDLIRRPVRRTGLALAAKQNAARAAAAKQKPRLSR